MTTEVHDHAEMAIETHNMAKQKQSSMLIVSFVSVMSGITSAGARYLGRWLGHGVSEVSAAHKVLYGTVQLSTLPS
ncbi:hypothetical protein IAQ61_006925 [Plenodomus lingam]|uniref:uncharacterized protein n=1 Tax=Leptosphaeria maculans TaxID=5022 RepID=UPI003324C347|nr:hypothetical protein IAQ61_006925 [Plenodomus lingam]